MTARTKRTPATRPHSGALTNAQKRPGEDVWIGFVVGHHDGRWLGMFRCRRNRDGPKGSTQAKVLRDQVALYVIRAREDHAADAVP